MKKYICRTEVSLNKGGLRKFRRLAYQNLRQHEFTDSIKNEAKPSLNLPSRIKSMFEDQIVTNHHRHRAINHIEIVTIPAETIDPIQLNRDVT